MAELHILGQLQLASNFQDKSSLFCRYSFQTGPNWTVVSGCPEGQTVSGKLDYERTVVWAHPLDIHYVTKGVQGMYFYYIRFNGEGPVQLDTYRLPFEKWHGWPKLLVQVSCLDSIGRSWIVGYGCCTLPAVPGPHIIHVNCWVPSTTSISDRIRQYFLGGSHQLIQSDIVNLGLNRFKLRTQSKGTIQLQVNLLLRNFNQFGVEYK